MTGLEFVEKVYNKHVENCVHLTEPALDNILSEFFLLDLEEQNNAIKSLAASLVACGLATKLLSMSLED